MSAAVRRGDRGAARTASATASRAQRRSWSSHIPYERGDVLAALHREGDVLVTVHDDAGTRVRARLPDAVVGRFAELVTAVDGARPHARR